jgi:hypothetical protein
MELKEYQNETIERVKFYLESLVGWQAKKE